MTTRKPRLLDLFCGAGGAATGYHRAGFEVVGVDVNPKVGAHYPFEFHAGDAMTWPLDGFDFVHASPPCQGYSVTASLHDVTYPRLVEPLRERLLASGLPFVIENVAGAPLLNPWLLCGSSFGLGVRRHRLFEVQPVVAAFVPPCAHYLQPEPVDVTGTGGSRLGERTDGAGGNSRKPRNLAHAREVMGIDWMSRTEIAEAIPPAYTEFIGTALLDELDSFREAS